MKTCTKCEQEKPHEEFPPRKRGRAGLNPWCRLCWQAYQRDYATKLRQRKRDKLTKLKAAPCMDCNRQFPPECMDFDHVRGKKSFDISRAGQNLTSWIRIDEEIKKCDLVCSNCHRTRTWRRNQ